jgi:hypothetical protein
LQLTPSLASRVRARLLPPATIAHHNLAPFITNGSALFQVSKGMYGLPQAGLLAQQRLIKHLAAHGYIQTQTACLFAHTTNGTVFTLVVDDFGVKYTTRAGADHLIATLQLLYQIKTNWTGTSYIGFNIAFDITRKTVTLSMPGYIAKVLKRFNIPANASAASPAVYTPPSYGAPLQEPTVDILTHRVWNRVEYRHNILMHAHMSCICRLHGSAAASSLKTASTIGGPPTVIEPILSLFRHCRKFSFLTALLSAS